MTKKKRKSKGLGSTRGDHFYAVKMWGQARMEAAREAVRLLSLLPLRENSCMRAESEMNRMEFYDGIVAADSKGSGSAAQTSAIKYAQKSGLNEMNLARRKFKALCKVVPR